ncbi:MAG: cyclic nucleotide-binding domain-containing protein [Actinomycetia bacterium]|nr:cyclic nucleotide-binding domain-containing protein [Actinomycetes bacterium]MCP4084689.1 cyclic nucleotide-binding domain-containing protein [Actinomycetes bacterium]
MFGRKAKQGADWLADVAFFEGFSPDELQRVVELAEKTEAARGDVIIEQGRMGDRCYVIVHGTVGVYYADEHVASLDEGSMVGEMALVDHRPRNATVVAEADTEMAVFDIESFRTLLNEMPRASERVLSLLSQRLRPS